MIPLAPRRRIHGGEHDAEVPVARVGDVALAAGQPVGAAGQPLGPRRQRRRVGAGLRLGDGEPAHPLAGQQRAQEPLLLLGAARRRQQLGDQGQDVGRGADGWPSSGPPPPSAARSAGATARCRRRATGIAPRTKPTSSSPGMTSTGSVRSRSAAGSSGAISSRYPRARRASAALPSSSWAQCGGSAWSASAVRPPCGQLNRPPETCTTSPVMNPACGGGQVEDRRGHVARLADALDAVVADGPLGDLVEGREPAQRRRVDEPGSDRVRGDPVAAELLGHGLGEADDAGLGRRVVRLAGVALPGAGRDGDDAAVALGRHQPRRTRGRTGTSRSGRRR